jgi:FixJ family two-component response regulator
MHLTNAMLDGTILQQKQKVIMVAQTIAILDGDSKRRASMSFTLNRLGRHAEPFEGIEELVYSWPKTGLLMAHDDGEAIAALVARMEGGCNWLPVIAYSAHPAPRQVASVILDGAIDYIAWPGPETDLVEAIRQAEPGARRHAMGELRSREITARMRVECLSRREREVLACVTEGLSNRLIGKRLEISSRTVEIHRAHILEKMEARSTSEAIRIAVESGIVLDNVGTGADAHNDNGFPHGPQGRTGEA